VELPQAFHLKHIPPKQDPSAAKTIQDKVKGNSDYHSDNAAFISKLKRS
jgi:hypothetical protein